MPRRPRLFGDDLHYHVIIRCNNKERLLSEIDFPIFLEMLREYKEEVHARIYDCALMQSHAHLLLSTHHGISLGVFMRDFCRSFAKDYNERHGRVGHLWRDRYWSRVVTNDHYAVACMRYFSWNAPKGGLVRFPHEWAWCGYRFYAFGEPHPILEPHPSYLGLGATVAMRQSRYREIVTTPLSVDEEWLFRDQNRPDSKTFHQRLTQAISPLMHRTVSGT